MFRSYLKNLFILSCLQVVLLSVPFSLVRFVLEYYDMPKISPRGVMSSGQNLSIRDLLWEQLNLVSGEAVLFLVMICLLVAFAIVFYTTTKFKDE